MSNSSSRALSTVVMTVLAVNAAYHTVQSVQFLLHLWPYTQEFAAQGAATSKALAMDDWEIVSTVLGLLASWGVAVLAWLVRSEVLRRPTTTA